jgi:hypothetical protein
MPADPGEKARVSARIDRLIEHYRRLTHRRLLRRAMRVWRHAELHHQITRLEAPPERVH